MAESLSSMKKMCKLTTKEGGGSLAATSFGVSLYLLSNYSKPVLSGHTKKDKKGFQDRLLLNAGQKYYRMLQSEHSAKLSTFIKIPFTITTSVCLF